MLCKKFHDIDESCPLLGVQQKNVELESRIEGKIRKGAILDGWFVAKLVSPGMRSMPDRFFIKHGCVVFLEVKRIGKEPTEKQANRHREMREHGAYVDWTDNVEDALNILKAFYTRYVQRCGPVRTRPEGVSGYGGGLSRRKSL
jgi:hypothetical protein